MSLITPNGEPRKDWQGRDILVCPKCGCDAHYYADTIAVGQPDPNRHRCETCLHFFVPKTEP